MGNNIHVYLHFSMFVCLYISAETTTVFNMWVIYLSPALTDCASKTAINPLSLHDSP